MFTSRSRPRSLQMAARPPSNNIDLALTASSLPDPDVLGTSAEPVLQNARNRIYIYGRIFHLSGALRLQVPPQARWRYHRTPPSTRAAGGTPAFGSATRPSCDPPTRSQTRCDRDPERDNNNAISIARKSQCGQPTSVALPSVELVASSESHMTRIRTRTRTRCAASRSPCSFTLVTKSLLSYSSCGHQNTRPACGSTPYPDS
ncbi:hypothetical protein BKA93DRAFT_35319 [Sparassis latifolia]